MLSIENKSVALYASPDGRQVAILDRNTGENPYVRIQMAMR